jgi:hypothetical protein
MVNASTNCTGRLSIRVLLTLRSSVNEQEILEILKPMIKQYALEKHDEGLQTFPDS